MQKVQCTMSLATLIMTFFHTHVANKRKIEPNSYMSQPLKWLPALTLNPILYQQLNWNLSNSLVSIFWMYTCRCKNRLKLVYFQKFPILFYHKLQLTATCPPRVKNLLTSSKQAIAHFLYKYKKKTTMKIKILQLQYLLLTTTLLSWGRCPGRPGASTFGKASP